MSSKRKKPLGGQATQLNFNTIVTEAQPKMKQTVRRGKLDKTFLEIRLFIPLDGISLTSKGGGLNG